MEEAGEMTGIQIDCTGMPEFMLDSSPRSMRFYSGEEPIWDWWFELLGEGTKGDREGRFLILSGYEFHLINEEQI